MSALDRRAMRDCGYLDRSFRTRARELPGNGFRLASPTIGSSSASWLERKSRWRERQASHGLSAK